MTEHISNEQQVSSCDANFSRAEFLKKVLGPAIAVGAVLASPKVVDKFILPAQAAPKTSLRHHDGGGDSGGSCS